MTQGSFAERLRVLRAQRGLALTEAAEQIGIDRHTLRDLELGGRTPRYPTLAKIAEGYGVPVEELLEESVPLVEAPEEGRPVSLAGSATGITGATGELTVTVRVSVLRETIQRVQQGEIDAEQGVKIILHEAA